MRAGRSMPPRLERAAAVQRETRQRIDVVISELGLVPAPALLAALSDFFGYPIIGEDSLPAFAVLEEQLPLGFLRRNGLLPIELTLETLVIATTDPFHTEAHAAVAYLVDKPVAPCLISQSDFALALKETLRSPRGPRSAEQAGANGDLRQRRRRPAPQGRGQRSAHHPARQSHHDGRRAAARVRHPH